ncbi:MAG: cellulase family glycosylhydrolase [Candidatus Hydrogenedentes bacterium]|nr:cellulase family glycosylhydrolase [Candidatus Hydrogenedentota bacterium]
MHPRSILTTLLVTASMATPLFGAVAAPPLPEATPQKLPIWRGFNLLEKFSLDWPKGPFREEDFQLIHELGFNFVRLPMDYRLWIVDGDWRAMDEAVIREIDEAVAWGGQYGIHVSINFHRAPGHTVAEPKETRDLWSDPEAQEVCALHWAYFARRYKDIPSERLSFNLFNEPGDIPGDVYARVAGKMVEAIRAEDPDRLIIADGALWGRKPCPELLPLGVAQATRGYEPMNITHYGATWVNTQGMVEPVWPLPLTNQLLFGPAKRDLQAPLVLEGPFPNGLTLRLRVGTVSDRSHLLVTADETPLWDREFVCGPGDGEWREAIWKEAWQVYQNRYDRDYEVDIPPGAARIALRNTAGDWMTITELGARPPGAPSGEETVLGLMLAWGEPNPTIHLARQGNAWSFTSEKKLDRTALWESGILPWRELEAQGCGVMVGEFGVFNQTPHDVALRWMEDCLRNWKEAGWGWALWNFRGSFGVIDSGRADVEYEDWRGHKLDRAMLSLLQRY